MERQSLHTEAMLAVRLIAGDTDAFDALYNQYYEAVYSNALSILKDIPAAEDIVQDVFLTLWEKRNALKHPENIAGWLFVIASNKSLNYLRRKLTQRLHPHPLELITDRAFITDDVEITDAQLDILKKAIDALPPKRKRVFEMCKLEGKSYEETATELQISKNTVKTQMVDAMNFIKDYILNQPGDAALVTGLITLLAAPSF